MSEITKVIQYFQAHWTEIAQAIAAIVGAASIIVKLTPGLKDDTVLQKIVAFLGKYIALNVSRADKVGTPAK